MTQAEIQFIAMKWIGEHYLPPVPWTLASASEPCLWEIVLKQPETAWQVILLIHQLVDTTFLQGALSSGPVEDLLVNHGPRFIDRIEIQAKADPRFASMLAGVWKSEMPDRVWKRLNAVKAREVPPDGSHRQQSDFGHAD